jgi:F0F1-type ATP synthase membrane subunit c/vacuolar-type H+-ATPase subunit K
LIFLNSGIELRCKLESGVESKTMKRVLRLLASGIAAGLAMAPAAFSQGCAQCYIEASASGSHAQKSLDVGILVLLLPSLIMFIGVIVLLIRRTRLANAA